MLQYWLTEKSHKIKAGLWDYLLDFLVSFIKEINSKTQNLSKQISNLLQSTDSYFSCFICEFWPGFR